MKNVTLGIGIGLIISALMSMGIDNAESKPAPLTLLEKDVLIEVLLKEAAKELKMEPPKPTTKNYPELKVTEKTMVEWVVCKNTGCSALAASVENYVFIANEVDLRTTAGQGIVYHELVHALQYSKYGTSPNCKEWVRREHEAYVLQDKWVSARGLDIPWLTQVHDKLDGFCKDFTNKR
jgi:hypothetical protein